MNSLLRLQNRVALVTGSSVGIGAAVAEAYGREGAKVVVNYHRNSEGAEATASRIRTGGGEALVCAADVSDASEVEAMVARTHQELGPIDILVNNAGIYPRQYWPDITAEQWDHVMDVNVRSIFLCAKAVYGDMQAAGYGKIINVSSIAALSGGSLMHYHASKAAILNITRSLAGQLGSYNICVNSILPGAVRVERELEVDPDPILRAGNFAGAFRNQCLKRRMRPVDMVGAFVFLASPESDFVTGQALTVDGGMTMH